MAGEITVTHSQGTDTIRSLTTQEAVVLSGGSLTIAAASAVNRSLTMSGGTLTGAGNVTIAGPLAWTGGSMLGTGSTFANGGITFSGSGNKVLGRRLDHAAGQSATWTGGHIGFQDAATLNNFGTFRAEHAGNLSFFNQGGAGNKVFVNAGTFIKAAPATGTVGITDVNSPITFNNSGTVQIEAGTLSLNGPFPNFSGNTLTGGTYVIAGTLRFNNADIQTNAATIVLDGLSSSIVTQSGADALAGFATNVAAGNFAVQNGRNFTTLGAFRNEGSLTVGRGSTFITRVDDEPLFSYAQTAAATLNVAIAGVVPGIDFGKLQALGGASLTGTLNVVLAGGFLPADGDQFAVATYASRTGAFASINGLDVGGGIVLDPVYNPDNLTLVTRGVQGNNPPLAQNDDPRTDEDTPVTFDVLANDSDPDGDALSISGFTLPASGQLTQNPDGTFTYSPSLNFHGTDSFTYSVRDGRGGTAIAMVDLAVRPVNDAPQAFGPSTATTQEDTDATIALGGTDVDGDPLAPRVTRLPARGTLFQTPDGVTRGTAITAAGTLVTDPGRRVLFAPLANENGTPYTSFAFVVNDGQADSAESTVTINVQAVNDTPAANPDTATTLAVTPVTIAVLANDTDVDRQSLRVDSVDATATIGTVVILSGATTVRYTPADTFTGVDTFAYTVRDTSGGTATATVTVTVQPNLTAELEVLSFSAPMGPLIGNPAQASVTWAVRNRGPVAGSATMWIDRVRFSANAVIGDADDVTLADQVHSGAVLPGASYPETRTVTLPANVSGQVFLYLQTDALNQVPEFQGEGNNRSALVPVDVQLPYADLIVEAVSVSPTAAQSGDRVQISYRVRNVGIAAINTSSWVDRVVLSDDDMLDVGDQELARVTQNAALGV